MSETVQTSRFERQQITPEHRVFLNYVEGKLEDVLFEDVDGLPPTRKLQYDITDPKLGLFADQATVWRRKFNDGDEYKIDFHLTGPQESRYVDCVIEHCLTTFEDEVK